MRTTADWLDDLVGSRGQGRVLVLSQLIRELERYPRADQIELGLDDASVSRLAHWHRFDDIAAQFPTRGAPERLPGFPRWGFVLTQRAPRAATRSCAATARPTTES